MELSATTASVEIIVTWGATYTPSPSGLVSWWDGDGNANDNMANNDGISMNGATFTQGKVGRACSLNRVNHYIQIPSSSSLTGLAF